MPTTILSAPTEPTDLSRESLLRRGVYYNNRTAEHRACHAITVPKEYAGILKGIKALERIEDGAKGNELRLRITDNEVSAEWDNPICPVGKNKRPEDGATVVFLHCGGPKNNLRWPEGTYSVRIEDGDLIVAFYDPTHWRAELPRHFADNIVIDCGGPSSYTQPEQFDEAEYPKGYAYRYLRQQSGMDDGAIKAVLDGYESRLGHNVRHPSLDYQHDPPAEEQMLERVLHMLAHRLIQSTPIIGGPNVFTETDKCCTFQV